MVVNGVYYGPNEGVVESTYSKYLEGAVFDNCIILFIEEIESVWFPRDGSKHNLFYLLDCSGKITTKYVTMQIRIFNKIEETKIDE